MCIAGYCPHFSFNGDELLCCAAHAVGLLTLEVACDGHVISNLVVFEYRVREMAPPTPSNKLTDWFGVSGARFCKKRHK